MKKVLLSAALLSLMMAGNAQVLTYGFEDGDNGKPETTNWENFPGSMFSISDGAKYSGANGLEVSTDVTCNTWERVYSFQEVALQENKSYRVSFMMKATAGININTGLIMGYWNCDHALQAGTQSSPVEQTKNIAATGEWQKVSYLTWNPSKEMMQALYKVAPYKNLEDFPVMPDNYYLRLAFTGAGSYFIDDVLIEEASIAGVRYNGLALTIDFGYATNLAELGKDGIVNLDTEAVTVNVNGEDKTPFAIEIQKDGCIYIFLAEDDALSETDAVKVSFKNPGDIKYSTSVAPNCFTEPNCAVLDFENEAATYDELLSATSFADAEPVMLSTMPVDGSFEIDPTTKEFSFTFDHMMDANCSYMKAYLDEEELVIKSTESSYTLVFERTSTEDLGKGTHTLKIEGVATDENYGNGWWNEGTVATSEFEVGSVQLSETIYTDLFTTLLSGAEARQPEGWSILIGGENWTGGDPKADDGNACRNINLTDINDNTYTAFYLCDRSGYTYMQYGDQDSASIVLPAGNLEFSVIAISHDDPGHTLEYRLEDLEGNVVATATGGCNVKAGQYGNTFTTLEAADYIPVKFNNPAEKNVILKIHALGGGYTAVRVLGFKVRSYIETEGDKDESEVIFSSNFTGGNMPAEGSGWLCYDNNNQLAPGSGRNGTSGMLERNFHAKMQSAAFFRECGANADAAHRIEYGNGNGVEGGLLITPGNYEIVYYAGTWNDAGGNAAGTSKVFFELIDAETGTVALHSEHVNIANFENGGNVNGQADKVVLNFRPSKTASYILKAWGTVNTVWGGLSITKEGSKAAKWHTALNEALALANDEMVSSEDAQFDGTVKSALAAAIAKYSADPNGMHTPEEYTAAIAELDSLTKALAARRLAIIAFKNDIATLGEKLETIMGTKYENVEAIKSLIEAYNTYAAVDPSTLENEELLPLQAKVTAGIGQVDKIKNIVDKMYTKQINDLLNAIALHAENLDNEFATSWIEKGEEAISDDQAVAGELQKILTAVIYKKIANGYNFQVIDEETAAAYPDSLEITGYVANNLIYTTMSATYDMNRRFSTVEEACEAFPGWNITEGTVSNIWWWENPLAIDEVTPAIQENVSIRNVGGNAFKVNQVLNNLPAGSFTLSMKTADMTNVSNIQNHDADGKVDDTLPWSNSVVYAKIGADSIACEANYGAGQVWRNAAATILPGIKTEQALESGAYTLTMTIGADMNCTRDAAQVGDTYLYMTGKMEGFDYAAAAEAILNGLTNGIEVVKREDAPTSVVYYNMNGQQSQAAQGVNLKVERYSDGYVVVRKVVIK